LETNYEEKDELRQMCNRRKPKTDKKYREILEDRMVEEMIKE